MAQMSEVFHALHRWFAERDIRADSLNVIFNFGDRQEAIRFEAELLQEFNSMAINREPMTEVRLFHMFGIGSKLESPVHGQHE